MAEKFTVQVDPSDRIFEELGNNTYTFVDLISELIDNSVAARIDSFVLNVIVEIGLASDRKNTWLVIRDDATGIPRDRLGAAISPGAQKGTGLNEHGLGMKQPNNSSK